MSKEKRKNKALRAENMEGNNEIELAENFKSNDDLCAKILIQVEML